MGDRSLPVTDINVIQNGDQESGKAVCRLQGNHVHELIQKIKWNIFHINQPFWRGLFRHVSILGIFSPFKRWTIQHLNGKVKLNAPETEIFLTEPKTGRP